MFNDLSNLNTISADGDLSPKSLSNPSPILTRGKVRVAVRIAQDLGEIAGPGEQLIFNGCIYFLRGVVGYVPQKQRQIKRPRVNLVKPLVNHPALNCGDYEKVVNR